MLHQRDISFISVGPISTLLSDRPQRQWGEYTCVIAAR